MKQVSRNIEVLLGSLADCEWGSVVGINGLDCSGKTTLAMALLDVCKQRGISTGLLHVDDYNDLEVQGEVYGEYVRSDTGSVLLETYYQGSIRYDDLHAAIEQERQRHKILIVEGVFLFRERLAGLFDKKVFLTVDTEIARARYARRKEEVGDNRPLSVFDDIWIPAFQRYCNEAKPDLQADLVIQS